MEKNETKSEGISHIQYSFILFVIHGGVNSKRARENLEHLCHKWLPPRYKIQVIDVLKDFQTALDYNILLTPTVAVVKPKPHIIIHGDLSNSQSFIEALNLDQDKNDN